MTARPRIRVLVCDDSSASRRALLRMLERAPLVEVVGVAGDGEEALRRTLELEPDLVTLDLEMPRLDGLSALRLLMARRPTPVIVISGRGGIDDVFRALDFGAVDFIAKPTVHAGPELERIEAELLRKVYAVRELRVDRASRRGPAGGLPPVARIPRDGGLPEVVVIGASTGGPRALVQLLGSFLEAPPIAVLVAQHMPEGFTAGFADRLDRLTPFGAREARLGDRPEPGTVLVAPGGAHMELESGPGGVAVRLRPRLAGDRYSPSVDRLFESAAKHYGERLVALVLTGMGDDGRLGVRAVKQAGGRVLAESEETAVVFGMPHQALRTGCVDASLPLPELPAALLAPAAGGAPGEGAR